MRHISVLTHLSAKLGNRLYEGRLAEGRRPLEGSVTTLVGVEEVDEVTGVAPATEGRDGDSGADTLWTGVTLVPLTQTTLKLHTSLQRLPATRAVRRHSSCRVALAGALSSFRERLAV
jgi:hypothetical protein